MRWWQVRGQRRLRTPAWTAGPLAEVSLQSMLDVLPFEVVVAANHHPEVLINRAARRSGGLPETGPITLDQLNRVLRTRW
jgi:hypothetical protein